MVNAYNVASNDRKKLHGNNKVSCIKIKNRQHHTIRFTQVISLNEDDVKVKKMNSTET